MSTAPPLGAHCAGCTRSPIGEPTWKPAGAAFFSGTVGLSGEDFLPLLQSIFAPKHRFYPEVGAFGPAVKHAGPYDDEVDGLLAAQGLTPRQAFTAAEMTPPLAVGMILTVVPGDAAPAGSSFDFSSGPIIPNDRFPISLNGNLYRNGSAYLRSFDGEVAGYDQFVPPIDADGASHLFVPFGVNSSLSPSDTPAAGSYAYTIVMLDPTGAGWAIRLPFTVAGDLGSDGGAGGDGGADRGVQPCIGSPPMSSLITNFSDAVANPSVTFGSAQGLMGGTFSYAAPGLTAPALSLATGADGGTGRALRVVANPGTPTGGGGFFGFGLYFNSCIDARAYNGVRFTIAGDLGTCSINFAPTFSEEVSHDLDPKGSCTETSCYPPSLPLTGTGTTSVRFIDLMGGNPSINDPAAVLGVQWQMNTPGDQPCAADFTVTDIAFVTDAQPPICPYAFPRPPAIIGGDSIGGGSPRAFTFSAPNLQPPTVYLVSSTEGQLQALEITANPGTTADPMNASVGFGVDLTGGFGCVDARAYAGVRFTATGDLGACQLTFSATPRQDLSGDQGGPCTAATCYPPRSGPIAIGTTTVRFSEMSGGSPYPTVDVGALSALQWNLTVPTNGDAGACKASLRITDVSFVTN